MLQQATHGPCLAHPLEATVARVEFIQGRGRLLEDQAGIVRMGRPCGVEQVLHGVRGLDPGQRRACAPYGRSRLRRVSQPCPDRLQVAKGQCACQVRRLGADHPDGAESDRGQQQVACRSRPHRKHRGGHVAGG